MPPRYGEDAIEFCRQLYCKFGGKNFDLIEKEMQKHWPGWGKQNLTRPNYGWIELYGFNVSLKEAAQAKIEAVNSGEQELYLNIRAMRKIYADRVKGKAATKDDKYLHRDYCKLEMDALAKIAGRGDSFGAFVGCYELLMKWLTEEDEDLAAQMAAKGEYLAKRAEAHYGEENAEAVE